MRRQVVEDKAIVGWHDSNTSQWIDWPSMVIWRLSKRWLLRIRGPVRCVVRSSLDQVEEYSAVAVLVRRCHNSSDCRYAIVLHPLKGSATRWNVILPIFSFPRREQQCVRPLANDLSSSPLRFHSKCWHSIDTFQHAPPEKQNDIAQHKMVKRVLTVKIAIQNPIRAPPITSVAWCLKSVTRDRHVKKAIATHRHCRKGFKNCILGQTRRASI